MIATKPWRLRNSVAAASTLSVAGVLALAGWLKLADPARFAEEIERYRLISPLQSALLAVYLPWLEIGLATALLVPGWRKIGRALGAGLIGLFCLVLCSALVRGLDIRCGCFGEAVGSSAGLALVRNLGLLALLGLSAWGDREGITPGDDAQG